MLNGFSRFPSRPDPHLKLYKVSRAYSAQGGRNAAVVPVSLIKRSVHLFPKWGRGRDAIWTLGPPRTVLEKCEGFLFKRIQRQAYLLQCVLIIALRAP